jgi:DNA-binding CsgD family transcriptional regulator
MAPGSSDKSEHGGKYMPGDDSLYKPPDVVLIDRQQWQYLRKRYRFSPKEVEVAQLVCRGLKNMEIAAQMSIKQGTVRTHLKSIFIKTRTRSKITLFLQLVSDAHAMPTEPKGPAHIPIHDYYKPTRKDPLGQQAPHKDEQH